MSYLKDFKRMAMGRELPGLHEEHDPRAALRSAVDLLDKLQPKLRAEASRLSGSPRWAKASALEPSRPAAEARSTCESKCVKCDGRLGAQNPGDTCDTCKWIKSQDKSKEKKKAKVESADDVEIAKIIAQQMGGKLKAMLGATLMAVPGGLKIKWPNKKRALGNVCVVTLRDDDTYDMEFFNGDKSVKKFEGLYAEDLKPTFEQHTGWYLSL